MEAIAFNGEFTLEQGTKTVGNEVYFKLPLKLAHSIQHLWLTWYFTL